MKNAKFLEINITFTYLTPLALQICSTKAKPYFKFSKSAEKNMKEIIENPSY